jgi:tetratricopeptide (TPR) repeat protein
MRDREALFVLNMLAVYDFAVSRISFDFFAYLALADLARRKAGADCLTLLLVPADGDGFHPNVQYDLDQKRWRLRNLVIDGAGLLPSCSGVMQAVSREHAKALIAAHDGPIHPRGYSVEEPVGYGEVGLLTIAANAGEDVQVLRASGQARTYAEQWLNARRDGRKAVALTLREATHNAQRNVAPEMWADFARYLERRGYFPFILRDIETALDMPVPAFDGIAECPAPVFNLDLRLAFYELTYLNVFVFNGPMALCGQSSATRLLGFAVEEKTPAVSRYFEEVGYAYGEPPPFINRLQRYIWRVPTPSVLVEEFEAMERRLNAHEAAGCPREDRALDIGYRRPWPHIARHFFNTRHWHLLDNLVETAERDGQGSAELTSIKAEAAAERLAFANDEKLFRQAAAARSDGRFEEAIVILQDIIDRRPSEIDPYAELGLSLEAVGRIHDAEALYRTAVARGVATGGIIYRLGCIAQGLGGLDDARACFEMLLAKTGDQEGDVINDVRARLAALGPC